MDSLCANVRSILEKAALSIGFPEEAAGRAVEVSHTDMPLETPNTYFRVIEISMVDGKPQLLMLSSNLDDKNLARFLVSALIDVMADWLTEASLEEMPQTLLGESFQFSSRTGRRMDETAAAQALVAQAGQRLTWQLEELLGVSISVIDSLSLERYEGTLVRGDLTIIYDQNLQCFTDDFLWTIDAPSASNCVHLKSKFLRHIVKLMAGCTPNTAVFQKRDARLGSPVLIGCADCKRVVEWERATKDVVRFHIESPMTWSFFFQGKCLFRRTYQGFRADLRDMEHELARKKLAKALRRKFQLNNDDVKRITEAVDAIHCQSHGSSVLIVEKDGMVWKHIENLVEHQKATRAQFAALDWGNGPENVLASVARIDGAIVMDTGGMIGFIAVIVDGSSCKKGKLSRGSRFNSMDNFVELWTQVGYPILGVVFSSDGGMDILPDS